MGTILAPGKWNSLLALIEKRIKKKNEEAAKEEEKEKRKNK